MIQEVKRIIKESEIMKYVPQIRLDVATPPTKLRTGKTIPSGLRRTRTDDRSWRSDLGTNTFRSR